jgi:hypothetical protein
MTSLELDHIRLGSHCEKFKQPFSIEVSTMIQDLTTSALRTTMEYMLKHSTTKYRGAHVRLRQLSNWPNIGSEKNVPLGLREYAALTETVDIEADWIRLKHHPHSRFLSRDDVCTLSRFLRLWEVEKHFQIQTSMIGCLCSYDSRTIYRFYSTTTRTGSYAFTFQVQGLLYVMRLWLIKALRTGKNGVYSQLQIMERSLFNLIMKQDIRYKVYSSYDLPHVYQRADRRNRQFTLLDIDDVYKSIGPDWTARLIIQHGDESDLTGETIVKMFSRDQNLLTLIASTKRNRMNVHGSHMVEDDLPTIRFLTLWALDRLPTECDLDSILCETDLDFMRRQPELPSFFCNFCPNHFRRYGWSYVFMLER